MSLNYELPNGATIGFNNIAERDAYLSSAAGAGARTQEAAMAANPGQSMEQIKNQSHASHYGVGGAGFGQAPLGTERNWGANADKNRWIAQQTGYGGDFGDGNFNQWSQQNGINGAQLEQQWAQRQGQGYALPQTMGFGGQQTMGFGQNNWAGLSGMQGLLGNTSMASPSFQFNSQPTWGSQSGGWGAPPGQANTGHNMLWSW